MIATEVLSCCGDEVQRLSEADTAQICLMSLQPGQNAGVDSGGVVGAHDDGVFRTGLALEDLACGRLGVAAWRAVVRGRRCRMPYGPIYAQMAEIARSPLGALLGRTLRRWRSAFLAYFATARDINGGTEAIDGIMELHRRLAAATATATTTASACSSPPSDSARDPHPDVRRAERVADERELFWR